MRWVSMTVAAKRAADVLSAGPFNESQRARVVQAGSHQCHQQDLDGHRHHRFCGVLNWPNPLPERPEVRVAQQSALLLGPLVRTRLRTAGALPRRSGGRATL